MDAPDPRLGEVAFDARGSTSLKSASLLFLILAIAGLPAGYFIPASEGAVKWIVFAGGAGAAVLGVAFRFVSRFVRLRAGSEGLLREHRLFRREEFLRWEDVVEIRSATWVLEYKYGLKAKKGELRLKTDSGEMVIGSEVPEIQDLVGVAERALAGRVLERAARELEEKGEARFGPLAFNRREIVVHDRDLSFRLDEVNNVFDDGRRMSILLKGRALAAWSGKAFDVPNRTAFYALVQEAMRELPKADEAEGALAGAEHKTALFVAQMGIIGALALLILGGGVLALCRDVLTFGLLPLTVFGWAALAASIVPGFAGLSSFRKATETGLVDTTLGGILKRWFWAAVVAGGAAVALLHALPREVVLDSPTAMRFLVGGRAYEAGPRAPARLRTLGLSRLELAATRGPETVEKLTLELKDGDKWLYNPKGEGVYQLVRVRYFNDGGKSAKRGSVRPLERIQGRAVIKADGWDYLLEMPDSIRSRSTVDKTALTWAD